MSSEGRMTLRDYIIAVPDFPKPGILFQDVTPIFSDKVAFKNMVCGMARFIDIFPDSFVGIEARGFIIASALAAEYSCGFVPIRKSGKLPRPVWSVEYESEYGKAYLDVHKDAFDDNCESVIIVDDVLATGGTALAAQKLVEKAGGEVASFIFLAEIESLGGREKLKGTHVDSLIRI